MHVVTEGHYSYECRNNLANNEVSSTDSESEEDDALLLATLVDLKNPLSTLSVILHISGFDSVCFLSCC